ncbi:Gfo/Idh/MocA family protein, partial [Hungatella sp.]|uniref:Gfo/Idh/MocA family protein n=1 Tax=Hungatella sp. TaxID=2613924 RepID=UPI003995F009
MAGYGIIGCGYAGGIHADNLAGLPGARLAAAFDLDYERSKAFVRDTGAYAAPTIEELCSNREVEAVIITTPNNSHVAPAILAAEAGKHVFCEKPVALSLKDTNEMLDAA